MGNGLDDFDSFHDDDYGSLLATIMASTMRADILSEKNHSLGCGAEHGQHSGCQANQGRAEEHRRADTNAGCFDRRGEPAGGGPPISLAQEEDVEQDFQRPDYGQEGNVVVMVAAGLRSRHPTRLVLSSAR